MDLHLSELVILYLCCIRIPPVLTESLLAPNLMYHGSKGQAVLGFGLRLRRNCLLNRKFLVVMHNVANMKADLPSELELRFLKDYI